MLFFINFTSYVTFLHTLKDALRSEGEVLVDMRHMSDNEALLEMLKPAPVLMPDYAVAPHNGRQPSVDWSYGEVSEGQFQPQLEPNGRQFPSAKFDVKRPSLRYPSTESAGDYRQTMAVASETPDLNRPSIRQMLPERTSVPLVSRNGNDSDASTALRSTVALRGRKIGTSGRVMSTADGNLKSRLSLAPGCKSSYLEDFAFYTICDLFTK